MTAAKAPCITFMISRYHSRIFVPASILIDCPIIESPPKEIKKEHNTTFVLELTAYDVMALQPTVISKIPLSTDFSSGEYI